MTEALPHRWAAQIAGALRRSGVCHVVVSPGSRSTPLALAFAARDDVTPTVVIDERSAGFVALGLAKATASPVALVCTSGSAAAHYLPAVVEASATGVPLIVITADRPWELHGFGAAQTMPQVGLFGGFVVDAQALSEPVDADDALLHLAAVVSRAAWRATVAPRGPVHLNAPFREPLAPVAPDAVPVLDPPAPRRAATRAVDVSEAAAALAGVKRGVIVCGPRERADGFGEAVHALGRHLGWPVLAEAASNARYGFDDAVAMYDVLLRDPRLGPGFAPEAILRFGGGATPKSLIGLGAPTVVLCSEDGRDVDPHHHAGVVVDGAAPAVARALRDALPAGGGAWRERWLAAEAAVRGALASGPVDGDPGTAGAVMRALPVGARVIVGSSMPIRDVDAFAPVAAPGVFVYANRGVNGIDGVISTAVGVARAGGGPTVALVGDLTLLHDVGAWLTARRLGVDLVVVVVNNDGGGIFHFLPVRDRTSRFEEYFGTSHGADLAAVAALGGARLHRPVGAEALASAIAEASDGGLHLIEVRSDREANVELHRSLFARLAAAVP